MNFSQKTKGRQSTSENIALPFSNAFSLGIKEVMGALRTSIHGLDEEEAKRRWERYGSNILSQKKNTPRIILIMRQGKSPLIGVLLVAMVVSGVLGELGDVSIIGVAVMINTVLGFIQEQKAENALFALQKTLLLKGRVIRSDQEIRLSSERIVVGDRVRVRSGDTVPADIRISEVKSLEVNESLLTGEVQGVQKISEKLSPKTILAERRNMLFAGTAITGGVATGVVTATGEHTEVGKISKLIAKTKKNATPLQRQLNSLSRFLAIFISLVSMGIFVLGTITGRPMAEMLRIALALAVAAIPEGMVVSLTVVLAVGMQRILKKRGLVRKLLAAETLGSTTVIATDKTGTLTTGNMQVVRVVTAQHTFLVSAHETNRRIVSKEMLTPYFLALDCGVASSDAIWMRGEEKNTKHRIIDGNLTDRALLEAALNTHRKPEEVNNRWKRIDAIPFDSGKKYSATLHARKQNKNFCILKGAPEKVLLQCETFLNGTHVMALDENARRALHQKFQQLSSEGLRMIAIAMADTDTANVNQAIRGRKFTFIAFFALKDPLRPQVRQAIQQCLAAGIRVIMITGDHALTARAIATELGLPSKKENSIEGAELAAMSDALFKKRISELSVYARVTPQDKIRIVKFLQKQGQVVAMTGDGVNDAPAIKQADIGIAVGSGTDVTKETADLVILNNDFSTIVHAVEEGRGIFETIRKVVVYLLAGSFSEIFVVAGSMIAGLPLALSAAQILWINLVTDGLPNLALTVEPKEKDIMQEPPRRRHDRLLNAFGKRLVIAVSLVTGFANFFLFWLVYTLTSNAAFAQSVTFASLAVSSLMYVLSIRSLRYSIFSKQQLKNPWIAISIVAGLGLQILAFTIPPLRALLGVVSLNAPAWGAAICSGAAVVAIIEVLKWRERIEKERTMLNKEKKLILS